MRNLGRTARKGVARTRHRRSRRAIDYWQVKELMVIGITSMAVLIPVFGITAA
jgi:hypothetical protein